MARILVVDDDTNLRTAARQILEQAGHEVNEASNGKEAIDFVRQQLVDLITTDVFMPDEDGIETLIEFRRGYPGVKIIVVSGGGQFGDDLYIETAKAFGADRILTKPFSKNEILKAVGELLGEEQPALRLEAEQAD